jgi:hypothetical protein
MRKFITLIAALLALSSCIENDIPYPVVEMDILNIEVEGAISKPNIDRANRKITVDIAENIDIRNVKITAIECSEGATLSRDMVGTFDMRYPQYVILSLYQDYEWVIVANQTIDRRFNVIGQIGETEWDTERTIAKVYRRADFGLDTVTVTQLRFGPKPEYDFPEASTFRNFNNADHTQTAIVDSYGRREIWRLIVEPKEVQVDVTRAVAGAKVVWLKATGIDGAQTGFRYRAKGTEAWSELEESWYTSRGGVIEAAIRHLTPQTEYEIIGYAVSDKGEQVSNVITVTTTTTFDLPNAQFNDWSTDGGTYYPYLNPESAWWGTGNPASKIAGINLTTPHTQNLAPGKTGTCAQLWSQKASVMGIGKFAAGNLFVGSFDRIVGTNGLVAFGHKFNLRPTALRGWVKYNCGTIDCYPSGTSSKIPGIGNPDKGSIYIALGDWDYNVYGGNEESPVLVDTRDESTFFNSSNAGIIAYGELIFNESCDWYEFEIPIEWRDFDRVPTHLIIVASGSSYGDYFVGSTESIMWLDDFELVYDYK